MKKIYNKIVSSVLVGATVMGAASCTNLDETLYSELTAEQYEFTPDDINRMVGPVYTSLATAFWGWFGYSDINEMGTDMWGVPYRVGIGWGDLYIPFHQHLYHSELGFLSSNWYYIYQGINICNQMLDNPQIQEDDATVAQIRAYRALYYYMVFDLFRNIPLDTTYMHEDGWLPEQASPQETFDFIVSELEDIKYNIPEEVILGKMNRWAVHMLLAKMYINRNAWFAPQPEDNVWYEKCLDELNEIINSGKFQLASTYLTNFKQSIAGSPEIIFGIPFEENYAGGNYSANLWMHEAGRATWEFSGWATGGGTAFPQFLETYDPDDQRYRDCWISGPQYARDGSPIMVDNDQLNYTREVHSINAAYPFEGERLVKYEICSGEQGTSYDDQAFFRYAEVLLMKAECLLNVGSYNGESENLAADLVTEVRRRNFNSAPGKAVRTLAQLKGGSVYNYGHRENLGEYDGPDDWYITEEGGADIVNGGLYDEYGWEFVGECVRRQVMIRFKLTNGQNVWNGKSWFCKDRSVDVQDVTKNIFPIPKDELDSNLKLVQNPGY